MTSRTTPPRTLTGRGRTRCREHRLPELVPASATHRGCWPPIFRGRVMRRRVIGGSCLTSLLMRCSVFAAAICPSSRFFLAVWYLTLPRQVQDWLFTRDAAKATAARALALASSKKARSLLPSTLDYAAAVSSAAAAPKDRDTASFSRSIKPAAPASMLRPAGSCAAPRAVPGARARSSSPKGQPSALSSIDAAITSMVAGGASGSTATQRHLKRTAARAAPLCAGVSGARKNVAAVPAPLQQLFSVIL